MWKTLQENFSLVYRSVHQKCLFMKWRGKKFVWNCSTFEVGIEKF